MPTTSVSGRPFLDVYEGDQGTGNHRETETPVVDQIADVITKGGTEKTAVEIKNIEWTKGADTGIGVMPSSWLLRCMPA